MTILYFLSKNNKYTVNVYLLDNFSSRQDTNLKSILFRIATIFHHKDHQTNFGAIQVKQPNQSIFLQFIQSYILAKFGFFCTPPGEILGWPLLNKLLDKNKEK